MLERIILSGRTAAVVFALSVLFVAAMVACRTEPEAVELPTVELHGPLDLLEFLATEVPEGATLEWRASELGPSASVPRVCYWMEIRPHVGMWVYIYLN